MALQPGQADIQQGIVGQHRAAAHHHGVMLGPQQMGPRPGRLARDPAALAGAGRDPPVQGHGQLQRHQRAVLPDAQEEAGIDLRRLALAEAEVDGHPAPLQPVDALAADPGIGILHGDDGAR